MNPAECAQAYGPAVARVCQRAVEIGWDARQAAGWLSTLAAVISGFVFAALVISLSQQLGSTDDSDEAKMDLGDSLSVFLSGFLSLLIASFLYALVTSLIHPLKIGAATSIATAVFAAGAVQTFVAIAWLFIASPRIIPAFGALKLSVRYVMFVSGVYLYVTVHKTQTVTSVSGWERPVTALFVLFLVGPWVAARAITRSEQMMARVPKPHVLAAGVSVGFLFVASMVMVWIIDRRPVSNAAAYPMWLAGVILLLVGFLYALYELNLPRSVHLPVGEGTTGSMAKGREEMSTRT